MPNARRPPTRFVSVIVLGLAALVGACTSTSTPRMRVAADLGCTAESTSVRRVEDVPEQSLAPGQSLARWEVTGCGRTAMYLCTIPVRDCWREGEVGALP